MASIKDMDDWGFDLSKCRLISEGDFEKLVKNGCQPLKNDVLIAKDGATYLDHIFVFDQAIELVLLSSVAILRANERVLPQFLAMTLREEPVFGKLKKLVSGAAIPRIVLKDFRAFPILMPPMVLQEAWGRIALPTLELISALRERNTRLRAARDLLLPKLLLGSASLWQLCVAALKFPLTISRP